MSMLFFWLNNYDKNEWKILIQPYIIYTNKFEKRFIESRTFKFIGHVKTQKDAKVSREDLQES